MVYIVADFVWQEGRLQVPNMKTDHLEVTNLLTVRRGAMRIENWAPSGHSIMPRQPMEEVISHTALAYFGNQKIHRLHKELTWNTLKRTWLCCLHYKVLSTLFKEVKWSSTEWRVKLLAPSCHLKTVIIIKINILNTFMPRIHNQTYFLLQVCKYCLPQSREESTCPLHPRPSRFPPRIPQSTMITKKRCMLCRHIVWKVSHIMNMWTSFFRKLKQHQTMNVKTQT